MESKTEFDQDLDDYLRGRRGGFFTNILRKQEPINPITPPQPEPIQPPEPLQKRGWFSTLFRGEELKEENQPNTPDYHDDVKSIVRISLEAVKLLPKEQLDQFKTSENFSKLKDLLKKHNFIK
jgi:hypothetical protein